MVDNTNFGHYELNEPIPSIWDCLDILPVDIIAEVRSDEELAPYYLVKVVKALHVLSMPVTDSYQHSFQPGCTVIAGHYFELVPKQDLSTT